MTVHREAWPEGTPSWVDLAVPDLEAARAFYSGLFGWEFADSGPDYGGYLVAQVGGEPVAGIGPTPPGMEGMPPVWTTYIAVDDVEASAAAVTEAGGHLLFPPGDVGDSGRMAIATDPTGAAFGMWQAGTNSGANRIDEHGCLVWNEAMVTDYAAGQKFYADVFGYAYEEMGTDGFTYATVTKDGRTVAGIGVASEVEPDAPSHWRNYFGVDDMSAAVGTVRELGGQVLAAPWETPFGLMAPVVGTNGEAFLLNQPPPPSG
jgi:predicted enzyme related to lactoylglutathione lyase